MARIFALLLIVLVVVPGTASGGLTGLASSSVAEMGGGWGQGLEAVLPANAATTGQDVTLTSISCPSSGNCSAVGNYIDNSGQTDGLLLSETNDSWSPGIEAALPADASTTHQAVELNSVSCVSAGNCTAGGTYNSTGADDLLLTETAGTWATGVEVGLPSGGTDAEVRSVSCSSAGNCSAVGSYETGSGNNSDGLLIDETAGSWASGVGVTLPADAATFNDPAGLSSVSCASDGNCTAVGGYLWMPTDDSWAGHPLMVTKTNGTWAAGVTGSPPANAETPDAQDGLGSVACASAGDCTAVGSYVATSLPGHEGLLMDETAGTWGTGVEAPLPSNVGTIGGPIYSLSPVTCTAPGNCTDVGTYFDTSAYGQGLLLTETAGTWAANEASLPADAFQEFALLNSVSCSSAGNCAAVGEYDQGAQNVNQGLVVTETAGTWETGVASTLPPDGAGNGEQAGLNAVSCAPDGGCSAVGIYADVDGYQGLLIGDPTPLVKLGVSRNGMGVGTVSSAPGGIDCGSACSASFDAGTSVTLTATAAAGSQFTGWSGGGCSGTGTCMVTMSAAESVTATFNAVPNFTLAISTAGTGSGTITSTPAGISCGSTCSHAYASGIPVTLSAAASSGSSFAGWTGGGCSGTNACQVTMSAARSVTATFNKIATPAKACVVPKVTGKALKAAESAIKSGHCRVGKISHAFSTKVKKGRVISQTPKPHKRLKSGAKVALIVSKGKH